MVDLRSLSRTCGGTGWLDCECGGDFCVCTLNGGIDCPGCADCRDYNAYDEGDDWDNDTTDCPYCGGSGEADPNTSDVNCDICDGSGRVAAPPLPPE